MRAQICFPKNQSRQDTKFAKSFDRRFSQINAEEDLFAAEAQRISFLFVGRRRQTKTFFKLELEVLPNRRLPIGQKGFPQRALRLCGEMSESLSAIIGENLRLKLFGCLAQPMNLLSVRL